MKKSNFTATYLFDCQFKNFSRSTRKTLCSSGWL